MSKPEDKSNSQEDPNSKKLEVTKENIELQNEILKQITESTMGVQNNIDSMIAHYEKIKEECKKKIAEADKEIEMLKKSKESNLEILKSCEKMEEQNKDFEKNNK